MRTIEATLRGRQEINVEAVEGGETVWDDASKSMCGVTEGRVHRRDDILAAREK